MYSKVLVTGGTGMLGKRLRKMFPTWIYIGSKQFDLTKKEDVDSMLLQYRPDAVIHLAARVGGIKDNAEHQAEYFYQNTMINTNVIHSAYQHEVKRVLASLSTCAFPDVCDTYPFTEQDLFKGPPALTNFSYGFSKRMLHVQCVSYRKQYGLNYSTFCPSNLYGPEDHFDSEKSHFVASALSKILNAKKNQTIEFMGTGNPLRQQLFIDDLCYAIPILLERHNSDVPLIIAPDENLSIKDSVNIIKTVLKKEVDISFNEGYDGQHRKDGSNGLFMKLIPGFKFTSFEDGTKETLEWLKTKKERKQ